VSGAETRPLAGQKAVVTGASGAIGGAVATLLAAEGVDLLLSGRDRDRLDAEAARLRGAGVRAAGFAADLVDDAAVAALAETAGEVDLLIHSLGLFAAGRIADTPVAELDRQLAVNLHSPYALTRALLPTLLRRQGQVVFVNSSVVFNVRATVGAYAASKAALRALADVLRDEVNPQGVRVLSVYPGRTASAMQVEVCRAAGIAYEPAKLLQPEDVAASIVAALKLPRTAEVTDLTVRPMQP
jgi:short-subunit dehydrogenase